MDYYPRNGRWEILIPALKSHVNQSNEYYITFIEGCLRIKLQHSFFIYLFFFIL